MSEARRMEWVVVDWFTLMMCRRLDELVAILEDGFIGRDLTR